MRFLALLLLLAAPALAKDAPDYGPAPDPAVGVAMVEAAIKAKLKDPYSAQFDWPYGFTAGSYRPIYARRQHGWITCGTVNARNSYGGYIGRRTIIGLIKNGALVFADIDDNTNFGANNGIESATCSKLGLPTR